MIVGKIMMLISARKLRSILIGLLSIRGSKPSGEDAPGVERVTLLSGGRRPQSLCALGQRQEVVLPDWFALGTEAEAALNDIRARWPQWQLRSPAQAGFHIWHESGGRIEGDSKKLEGVPDSELVDEAKRLAAAADFLDGDSGLSRRR